MLSTLHSLLPFNFIGKDWHIFIGSYQSLFFLTGDDYSLCADDDGWMDGWLDALPQGWKFITGHGCFVSYTEVSL
jgi:hypothetical protein